MSARVSPRDREIIALRAHGLTHTEIGDRFGLSRQRIAQILDRAATHTPAHPAATSRERPPATGRPADQRPRSNPTPQAGQTPAAVTARRAQVRQLLAQGLPPSQIAARLGHRLTTMYADLAWIRAAEAQRPSPR